MNCVLKVFWRIAPPVGVLIAVILVWEIWVVAGSIPAYLLPGPWAVLMSFGKWRGELAESLGWTALAALSGFLISALLGTVLAVALSTSNFLRRALYPYTVFFQTVPIVAIAPMLIIWVGFGLPPVVVCATIVSIFPVIANTLVGMLSTDPALVDLFRLYGASPLSALWKLRLPSALPNILTGLRIAAGLAVIGTIVAEFSVGELGDREGLGLRILSASKQSQTDLAFAAVLLASLLGLTLFGAVNLAGHLALRRWHASERS
jgi:NitT/TauT family transport system permease protein